MKLGKMQKAIIFILIIIVAVCIGLAIKINLTNNSDEITVLTSDADKIVDNCKTNTIEEIEREYGIEKQEPEELINLLENKTNYSQSADEENIISLIKEAYPDFDVKNYEVRKSGGKNGGQAVSVTTGEVTYGPEYILYEFKIGKFRTLAGFNAKIKDGKLIAIYDLNIDLAKQEEALKNKNKFKTLSTKQEEKLKNSAVEKIKSGNISDEQLEVTIEDTMYFYDIEKDKKYFTVSLVIKTGSGREEAYSGTTVDYEI